MPAVHRSYCPTWVLPFSWLCEAGFSTGVLLSPWLCEAGFCGCYRPQHRVWVLPSPWLCEAGLSDVGATVSMTVRGGLVRRKWVLPSPWLCEAGFSTGVLLSPWLCEAGFCGCYRPQHRVWVLPSPWLCEAGLSDVGATVSMAVRGGLVRRKWVLPSPRDMVSLAVSLGYPLRTLCCTCL